MSTSKQIILTSLLLFAGIACADSNIDTTKEDTITEDGAASQVALTAALESSSPTVPTSPVEEETVKQIQAKYSSAETCTKIERKLGSVYPKDCEIGGLEISGVSVKGTPILVKEYPPVSSRKPLGRVLLVGGIHGDEYSSVSIVFAWMRKLNQFHSGMFHWKVVPLMNPDGLLRNKAQRMNDNGVDLNRNFPTPNWETESQKYWVERTKSNPRRYPGLTPLSEPESQWLAKLIKEFKPDAIVAVHAPYGILDFDGPRTAPKRLGHLHLNLLGTYPGSLGNYAGVQNKIPVVTIELPYAGIMPTREQVSSIWVDMVGWLKKNMHTIPQEASQGGSVESRVDATS